MDDVEKKEEAATNAALRQFSREGWIRREQVIQAYDKIKEMMAELEIFRLYLLDKMNNVTPQEITCPKRFSQVNLDNEATQELSRLVEVSRLIRHELMDSTEVFIPLNDSPEVDLTLINNDNLFANIGRTMCNLYAEVNSQITSHYRDMERHITAGNVHDAVRAQSARDEAQQLRKVLKPIVDMLLELKQKQEEEKDG